MRGSIVTAITLGFGVLAGLLGENRRFRRPLPSRRNGSPSVRRRSPMGSVGSTGSRRGISPVARATTKRRQHAPRPDPAAVPAASRHLAGRSRWQGPPGDPPSRRGASTPKQPGCFRHLRHRDGERHEENDRRQISPIGSRILSLSPLKSSATGPAPTSVSSSVVQERPPSAGPICRQSMEAAE